MVDPLGLWGMGLKSIDNDNKADSSANNVGHDHGDDGDDERLSQPVRSPQTVMQEKADSLRIANRTDERANIGSQPVATYGPSKAAEAEQERQARMRALLASEEEEPLEETGTGKLTKEQEYEDFIYNIPDGLSIVPEDAEDQGVDLGSEDSTGSTKPEAPDVSRAIEYLTSSPEELQSNPWGGKIGLWGEGRTFSDGPMEGNWGGKLYSGGVTGGMIGPAQPLHTADERYMQHDFNIQKALTVDVLGDVEETRQRMIDEANRQLVEELEELDDDPSKWPNPPPKGSEDAANLMRHGAILWFKYIE